VIFGAAVFELKDLSAGTLSANLLPYIVGSLTAAVFGYLAIKVVLKLVNRGNLSIFSYYCWVLAAYTLTWAFSGA
jgi:undecaprenyl-diphosphatase